VKIIHFLEIFLKLFPLYLFIFIQLSIFIQIIHFLETALKNYPFFRDGFKKLSIFRDCLKNTFSHSRIESLAETFFDCVLMWLERGFSKMSIPVTDGDWPQDKVFYFYIAFDKIAQTKQSRGQPQCSESTCRPHSRVDVAFRYFRFCI
jgi:hypothetical protein